MMYNLWRQTEKDEPWEQMMSFNSPEVATLVFVIASRCVVPATTLIPDIRSGNGYIITNVATGDNWLVVNDTIDPNQVRKTKLAPAEWN